MSFDKNGFMEFINDTFSYDAQTKKLINNVITWAAENIEEDKISDFIYQVIDEPTMEEIRAFDDKNNFYWNIKNNLKTALSDILSSVNTDIDTEDTNYYLSQDIKDNCYDFIYENRDKEDIVFNVIHSFAYDRADSSSERLWKNSYHYRHFTEEVIENKFISLDDNVSMLDILKAGQVLAYEKGIHENIFALSKSMTILNILDDVDNCKKELINLGVHLTKEEANEFSRELYEYIEFLSEKIAFNNRQIVHLDTIEYGTFKSLVEKYQDKISNHIDGFENDEKISVIGKLSEYKEKIKSEDIKMDTKEYPDKNKGEQMR